MRITLLLLFYSCGFKRNNFCPFRSLGCASHSLCGNVCDFRPCVRNGWKLVFLCCSQYVPETIYGRSRRGDERSSWNWILYFFAVIDRFLTVSGRPETLFSRKPASIGHRYRRSCVTWPKQTPKSDSQTAFLPRRSGRRRSREKEPSAT